MKTILKGTLILTIGLSLVFLPLTTASALSGMDIIKPPIMSLPKAPEEAGTWPSVYDMKASNLTITPIWGTDKATLTWDDPNSNETGFILQNVFQEGLSVMAYQTLAEYPANTTSATITVPKGKISQYALISVNSAQGKSSPTSNLVTIEGLAFKPTEFTVAPDPSGANAISLTWKNPSENANLPVKWIIERSAPGTWPSIFKPETTEFLDVNVKPDILYTYALKAVSESGETNPLVCSFSYPSPPQNFEVAAWPGSTALSVTWKDTRSIVDHFELVYKQKGYDDSNAKMLSFAANIQNTQIVVANGTTYEFKIRSVMKQGNPSPYSPVVVFAPFGGEIAPAIPTEFVLKAGDKGIDITFKEISLNVEQYLVERTGNDGSKPIVYGTIPNDGNISVSGLVTITDNLDLKAGITYTYRIKAQNTYGESAFTSPVSIAYKITKPAPTEPPVPPTPQEPFSPAKKIVLVLGSSKMDVDGVNLDIDPGNGTKSFVSTGGRAMIPISSLIDKLGGTTQWSPSEKKVTIMLNGRVVELVIGQVKSLVDGKIVISDEAPQIVNGRTMLPLRFVAENLGLNVVWDSNNKTITVKP